MENLILTHPNGASLMARRLSSISPCKPLWRSVWIRTFIPRLRPKVPCLRDVEIYDYPALTELRPFAARRSVDRRGGPGLLPQLGCCCCWERDGETALFDAQILPKLALPSNTCALVGLKPPRRYRSFEQLKVRFPFLLPAGSARLPGTSFH